jgi:hypothetical protein
MPKYLLLVFFTALCIISLPSKGQRVTPCGYIIPPRTLKNSFQSVYEAKQIVNNMLDSIQWKENFNLREQNGIQNAYAKTKWASMSIMAHEMGHHYYNHVVSAQGSTVPREIEADAFSGYIMQKMGATLEQALAAMKAIGTDKQTSTHPAKSDRLTAITRGWNTAKQSNSSPANANAGTNTTPPNNGNTNTGSSSTQTNPQTDPSWIALTIQSSNDETVQLSDDGKNFQAATIKAGQPFILKFEIYQWGWLRLPYYNGYRSFKLLHGKDYTILYNRRSKNWTVVEVPE